MAYLVVKLASAGAIFPLLALYEIHEEQCVGRIAPRLAAKLNIFCKLRHPIHDALAVTLKELLRREVRREVCRGERIHAVFENIIQKPRLSCR